MPQPADTVIVGRIGKAYGIKGWVRLYSFTQPVENILSYQPWLIKQKNSWQQLEIEASKAHQGSLLIKLVGVETPESAQAYVNADVIVKREQLPALAEDEFYWHDLVGFTVVNQAGIELGKLDHWLATGANDVIVVKGEKEHLIPFLMQQFVLEVDAAAKRITVDWDPEF